MTRYDVAIIGAGPGGATLAAMLAMRGFKVLIFDDDKRPDLIVGESLLPTVITYMQKLGIEERAKEFSQYKPGVTFISRDYEQLDFYFPNKTLKGLPNYAYNVPRADFDELLRVRAKELGATFIHQRAGVVKSNDPSRELVFDEATLDAVPELRAHPPKMIVDATGRARLAARALNLEAARGKRNDAAYFAHYRNFEMPPGLKDGQIVISTLERGWSWRIPLPGRVSVGIVLDKAAATPFGKTAEERLEAIIDHEPLLRDAGRHRERVSDVMTYGNYQLISERGHGPGWVAAGDAFGFVDPMLSPGLFMSMLSAELLDTLAFNDGPSSLDHPKKLAERFDHIFAELRDWHASWEEIIECFYDGRMHSLSEARRGIINDSHRFSIAPIMERHVTRQITSIVSGARTRNRYARAVVQFATKHLNVGVKPPAHYAVLTGPRDPRATDAPQPTAANPKTT